MRLLQLVNSCSLPAKDLPVSRRETLQHLDIEFLVRDNLLQTTVIILKAVSDASLPHPARHRTTDASEVRRRSDRKSLQSNRPSLTGEQHHEPS